MDRGVAYNECRVEYRQWSVNREITNGTFPKHGTPQLVSGRMDEARSSHSFIGKISDSLVGQLGNLYKFP